MTLRLVALMIESKPELIVQCVVIVPVAIRRGDDVEVLVQVTMLVQEQRGSRKDGPEDQGRNERNQAEDPCPARSCSIRPTECHALPVSTHRVAS